VVAVARAATLLEQHLYLQAQRIQSLLVLVVVLAEMVVIHQLSLYPQLVEDGAVTMTVKL
jgi:hypothetical protein